MNELDPIRLIQGTTQKPKPENLPARIKYVKKPKPEVKIFDIDGKELITIKQAAEETDFNLESASQDVRRRSGLEPSANLVTSGQAGLYEKEAVVAFLTEVQKIRKSGRRLKRK